MAGLSTVIGPDGQPMQQDENGVWVTPWAARNPFAQQGFNDYQFVSTKHEVDLVWLTSALSSVLAVDRADLHIASTVEFPQAPISTTNPLYVFVSCPVPLDSGTIQGVIDRSVPVPVEQPVATTPAGVQVTTSDPDTLAAIAKAQDGHTLTTKEISSILRALLGGAS